jgi:hypothetical protein
MAQVSNGQAWILNGIEIEDTKAGKGCGRPAWPHKFLR